MARFRHPHLTRGTIYTPVGAFAVSRGIIEAADDIGQAFGWRRIEEEDSGGVAVAERPLSDQPADASGHARR